MRDLRFQWSRALKLSCVSALHLKKVAMPQTASSYYHYLEHLHCCHHISLHHYFRGSKGITIFTTSPTLVDVGSEGLRQKWHIIFMYEYKRSSITVNATKRFLHRTSCCILTFA